MNKFVGLLIIISLVQFATACGRRRKCRKEVGACPAPGIPPPPPLAPPPPPPLPFPHLGGSIDPAPLPLPHFPGAGHTSSLLGIPAPAGLPPNPVGLPVPAPGVPPGLAGIPPAFSPPAGPGGAASLLGRVSFKESVNDQGFLDSAAVISELLGPFGVESILALSGGGMEEETVVSSNALSPAGVASFDVPSLIVPRWNTLTRQRIKNNRHNFLDSAVYNSRDLTCGFDVPCCWHNIAGGDDDLQWAVLSEQPETSKAFKQFAVETLPEAPFAVTGARKTHSYVYSFLVSCPILCQQEEGTLKFKQWTSNGVVLDVCTLPLDSRNFTFCQTMPKQAEVDVKVTIPSQKEPFVLVIVGSEFTKESGGVAGVDDIEYFGPLCQPGEEAGQRNEISGPQFHSLCLALDCDFQADGAESLCRYKESDIDGTKSFVRSSGRTGNYASGVPFPNDKEFYLAAGLKPGETAVLQSESFNITEDVRMSFDFFETGHEVSMSVCLEYSKTDLQCQEVSSNQVLPHHRRWRRDFVTIPRGENKAIYFLAENTGYNQATVGLSRVRLSDGFGSKIRCDYSDGEYSDIPDNPGLKLVESYVEEQYYDFEENFDKQS